MATSTVNGEEEATSQLLKLPATPTVNGEEEESQLLNLPEDISDEILLRVPARSVLQSRCVCRYFNTHLSNPLFIKKHVIRTTKTSNRNAKFVFQHIPRIRNEGPKLYSVPIQYTTEHECILLTESSQDCCYPFKPRSLYFFDVLGSCNGLICMTIHYITKSERGQKVQSDCFGILNPLTREFREREFEITPGCAYGFGYDSISADYKLVRLTSSSRIDVYSLRSDSWTSVQGTDSYAFPYGKASCGVFFNGCIHWIARVTTKKISCTAILRFDVRNEILTKMLLPESLMGQPQDFEGKVYRNVGLGGGCIGISVIWEKSVEVWVMQQYGVEESWARKYTKKELPSLSHRVAFWRPLWCFDTGEVLVDIAGTADRQLVLHNPTAGEITSVMVHDVSVYDSGVNYVESLVSVGSGTYPKREIPDVVVKNLQ